MPKFLEYTSDHHVPLDFFTRHHYTGGMHEEEGRYGYADLHTPEHIIEAVTETRSIIDGFSECEGMDIHLTEFNTSYAFNCPLHDTNLNAAMLAFILSKLGEQCACYSYWTFGDVFEEQGIPFTPFHGGFGLVAKGQIPKPTFRTFAFFKKLQGDCVLKEEDTVAVKMEDGSYREVAWNIADTADLEKKIALCFDAEKGAEYTVITKTVDEVCCNPRKIWHDMGEPANPSKEQIRLLWESAVPLIASTRMAERDGYASLTLCLGRNAVVYYEIKQSIITSDRGFHYDRVRKTDQCNG